jgi:hypothetical protein
VVLSSPLGTSFLPTSEHFSRLWFFFLTSWSCHEHVWATTTYDRRNERPQTTDRRTACDLSDEANGSETGMVPLAWTRQQDSYRLCFCSVPAPGRPLVLPSCGTHVNSKSLTHRPTDRLWIKHLTCHPCERSPLRRLDICDISAHCVARATSHTCLLTLCCSCRHTPRPCFTRVFSIVCLRRGACCTLAPIASAIEPCFLASRVLCPQKPQPFIRHRKPSQSLRQWTQKHSSALRFAHLIMSAPSNFSAPGTTSNAHTQCTTTDDADTASTLAASNSTTSSSTAPKSSGRNRGVEV